MVRVLTWTLSNCYHKVYSRHPCTYISKNLGSRATIYKASLVLFTFIVSIRIVE
jgi:hypothetical protein